MEGKTLYKSDVYFKNQLLKKEGHKISTRQNRRLKRSKTILQTTVVLETRRHTLYRKKGGDGQNFEKRNSDHNLLN